MERVFSPCTRLYDLIENQGDIDEEMRDDLHFIEERILNVSTQEFRSADLGFRYADLHTMLDGGDKSTMLWFTPNAAVFRDSAIANISSVFAGNDYSFSFSANGELIYAAARSSEHLLELCDVVLRLLAASVVQSVRLSDFSPPFLSDAPNLEYLMEQCQSLKVLSLEHLRMDENHCRVLGDVSRPDLEIELKQCILTSAGASALVEVLGRNQGPTKLEYCDIDNVVLVDGLRGNSRLKSLKLRPYNNLAVGNRQVLAIAGALRENKGLVELDLGSDFSNGTWGAVCDSLETHPTLEVLTLLRDAAFTEATTIPAVLTFRIEALLDMLKVNMTIHTIHVDSCYSQHKLFRGTIIPYLETNRFRPHLLAIQKTRPIPYRAKVLGRALFAARADANNIWMLLSGNAEVAFPSRTTTIATAANLPAPATVAATSTTNVAATALTTTATDSLSKAATSMSVSASTVLLLLLLMLLHHIFYASKLNNI
jgi:hypothetical protein